MTSLITLAANVIPLVADIVPSLVRFLVGGKAADTTEKVSNAAKLVVSAVKKVTGKDVSTKEDVVEVKQLLQDNPELRNQLYIELSRVDLELERIELERDKAYLADRQDARNTSISRLQNDGSENRANVMLIAAFVAVVAIVALLIINKNIPKEVVGFVISIGGMFARNIGSAFDFEFGSSKGSKIKDDKLQKVASELIADKKLELKSMTNFAKQQVETAQAVGSMAKVVSSASKLREIIRSS